MEVDKWGQGRRYHARVAPGGLLRAREAHRLTMTTGSRSGCLEAWTTAEAASE